MALNFGNYQFNPQGISQGASNAWGNASGVLSQFDPTNTPKYSQPNYYGQGEAGANTLAGARAMGINPFKMGNAVDTRDASRAAIMGQLDQQGQSARTMSDQTYANRGSGAYRSGAARAGLDRVNVGLAQAKAGAEAGIQADFANRQQAIDMANMGSQNQYNAMLMGGMQNDMANRNQFNMGQADRSYQFNQMNPFTAKQDVLQGAMNLGGKAAGWIFG